MFLLSLQAFGIGKVFSMGGMLCCMVWGGKLVSVILFPFRKSIGSPILFPQISNLWFWKKRGIYTTLQSIPNKQPSYKEQKELYTFISISEFAQNSEKGKKNLILQSLATAEGSIYVSLLHTPFQTNGFSSTRIYLSISWSKVDAFCWKILWFLSILRLILYIVAVNAFLKRIVLLNLVSFAFWIYHAITSDKVEGIWLTVFY